MEKHIYIMLSHTNTKIGKMIRLFTDYPYNHISISTNSSLQPLYSFARYHYNAALIGGFVEESPLRYLFYGKDTPIRIYDITVTEKQFQQLESSLNIYIKNKSKYLYDNFYFLRNDKKRSLYHHTCLSFAVSILKELDILTSDTQINTIKQFAESLSSFSFIEMKLDTQAKTLYTWGNDEFYQETPSKLIFMNTINHFRKLLS